MVTFSLMELPAFLVVKPHVAGEIPSSLWSVAGNKGDGLNLGSFLKAQVLNT